LTLDGPIYSVADPVELINSFMIPEFSGSGTASISSSIGGSYTVSVTVTKTCAGITCIGTHAVTAPPLIGTCESFKNESDTQILELEIDVGDPCFVIVIRASVRFDQVSQIFYDAGPNAWQQQSTASTYPSFHMKHKV
jgi:hypothetical protein